MFVALTGDYGTPVVEKWSELHESCRRDVKSVEDRILCGVPDLLMHKTISHYSDNKPSLQDSPTTLWYSFDFPRCHK